MPRRIDLPTGVIVPRVTVAALGDSMTYNHTLGVPMESFYPERLAVALRALGAPVRARNFGRNGRTSTGAVPMVPYLLDTDTPKLAIIWIGVNDPGNSIVGATTQANIETMGETLLDAGVDYLIVGNTQYLNYTSGGDSLVTPFATYATLRPFQAAAATALETAYPGRVALCDIYGYMRNLIVAGTETAASASWHVAGTDQHLNALGNQYVADAMLATIQAQDGWIEALGGIES